MVFPAVSGAQHADGDVKHNNVLNTREESNRFFRYDCTQARHAVAIVSSFRVQSFRLGLASKSMRLHIAPGEY